MGGKRMAMRLLALASLMLAQSAVGQFWDPSTNTLGEQIRDTYFVDQSNGWVVGIGGMIATSADGGGTWSAQTSGTTENLYRVHFVDTSNGYAVGDNGVIVATTDGGANWAPLISGSTKNLYGVYFRDVSNGIVVGTNGEILITTNGGTSWAAPTTNPNPGTMRAVKMLDASVGYIVGDGGYVMRTADGGDSWTPQTSGTGEMLIAMDFVDATTGWVSGQNGVILTTADGGTNWTPQTSGVTGSLVSVEFLDASSGYVLSASGDLLYTSDGGANWATQSLVSGGEELRTVQFVDSNTGWVVGGVTGTSATILKFYPAPTTKVCQGEVLVEVEGSYTVSAVTSATPRPCTVMFQGPVGTNLAIDWIQVDFAYNELCDSDFVLVHKGLDNADEPTFIQIDPPAPNANSRKVCGTAEPDRVSSAGNAARLALDNMANASSFTVYVSHNTNQLSFQLDSRPSFYLGSDIIIDYELEIASVDTDDFGWIGIYKPDSCLDTMYASDGHVEYHPHECYLAAKPIPSKSTSGSVTFKHSEYKTAGFFDLRYFAGDASGVHCAVESVHQAPLMNETHAAYYEFSQCKYKAVSTTSIYVDSNFRNSANSGGYASSVPGWEGYTTGGAPSYVPPAPPS